MLVIVWLAGPAVGAAVLTMITRVRWGRAYLVLLAGILLAAAFVLFAYLAAPPDFQHSHGAIEGEMFLGRWWEPEWIAFMAIVGYLSWVLGTVAGLVLRGASDLVRPKVR